MYVDLTALAHEAMLEKGFQPDYSDEVLEELKSLNEPSFPLEQINARDMRQLLWFSIDNDDSRDLDQLTFAETLPDNQYRIYVAVAYVDLLVKKNSAIDRRAAQNTTSVYTPTKIFPMLPEKLSTDLTSLNQSQERLALIFEATLASDGKLLKGQTYLGYVKNKAKLAYNSIGDWLDGKISAPPLVNTTPGLSEQIKLQDAIAQKLESLRQELGALSVETIEALPIITEGVPVEILAARKNRATLLIENFMITANTISAQYSAANNIISLRRVVTVPKRWDKIVAIAAEYGFSLPESPDPKALEKFLLVQKKADPVTFPDLSLRIIKLLGKGEYHISLPGKKNPGHFGLALRDYSHSTAPNRRFPDLITQRLLIASLEKKSPPYSQKELEQLAEHCTLKEDEAEKIERRLKKCAAALVLSTSIGKEFDAIVTGANDKGTWVRIFNPPVDGKLVRSKVNVDVGDKIKVKLIYTDPRAGYIDFAQSH